MKKLIKQNQEEARHEQYLGRPLTAVKVLKAGLWLQCFNLLFATLAIMAMYFPGGGWLAGLVFLYLIVRYAKDLSSGGLSPRQLVFSALIGQLPGLTFTALACWSWYQYGPLTSDFDFLVQMWNAPMICFISVIPPITWRGFTLAYLATFLISPLLVVLMAVIAVLAGRFDISENRYRIPESE